MAATMAAYLGGITPNFWASWGGDLATGMANTTERIADRDQGNGYAGMLNSEIADATIGDAASKCNYSDFCSDFDAYKVQEIVGSMLNQTGNYHVLSEAMHQYYDTGMYVNRFQWIAEELNCSCSYNDLRNAIYKKMNGVDENVGLLVLKGKSPSQEVNALCCNALAKYIYSIN